MLHVGTLPSRPERATVGKGMEGQGVPGLGGPQGGTPGSILPGLDATSQDSSNYGIQMVDTN